MSACVDFLAEHFEAQRVQQQARGDVAVRRDPSRSARAPPASSDLRTSSIGTPSYRSFSVACRMRRGRRRGRAFARLLHERGDLARSSGRTLPLSVTLIVGCAATASRLRFALLRALLRALLAIQHVGARDFVLAGAHQRELDLVLDFFDMERAAARLPAHQCADHQSRSAWRPARARARTPRPGRRSPRGTPWSSRSRSSTARSRPRRRCGG